MASFIENFRSALANSPSTNLQNILRPSLQEIQRPDITNGAHSAERNGGNKSRTEVIGFEEDKANYGDTRDASKLDWFGYTALNNDTGQKMTFEVGYDQDGKINGVRQWEGPAQKSYLGREAVSQFFKSNFDRDATNYSIYDSTPGGAISHGYRPVWFDSEMDGAFIPSVSLGRLSAPRSAVIDFSNSEVSNPTISEQLKKQEKEAGTRERTRYVELGDIPESAYNGSLFIDDNLYNHPMSVEESSFFAENAKDFIHMLADYSNTDIPIDRVKMLQKAYDKFSSGSKIFRAYIESLMESEDMNFESGKELYDYRSAFPSLAPIIEKVRQRINPRA